MFYQQTALPRRSVLDRLDTAGKFSRVTFTTRFVFGTFYYCALIALAQFYLRDSMEFVVT